MRMAPHLNQKGFGLVESIVATSIVAIFIVVLSSINTLYIKTASNQSSNIEAAFLAEEGIEAMRFARDESWTSKIAPLTSGVNYYLAFTGTTWQATTTPVNIGIFDRRIIINNVSRDSSDNIVSSGGTLDANTKKITSKVSWVNRGATSTETVSTYLTNLFAN